MGEYTGFLSAKGRRISPEDDNYRQELLDAAASFRTFDCALNEFIASHGFTGDSSDTEACVRFIQEKFDAAGIPMETRLLRGWFQKHTQAGSREIALRFCFAFRLTPIEAQDFFRRVYLQRSMDCHNVKEIIYFYCLSRGLTYADAQALLARAPAVDSRGRIERDADVLYTGTILRELDRFQTPEALLAFLNENRDQFRYNNATAKKYITGLWYRISGAGGIACREFCRRHPNLPAPEGSRSVWDIYRQIFGLLDYDEEDHSLLYQFEGDRTVQPLLKANAMIHPLVRKSFPDRQGLEAIINGNWQSDEVIRKTLILLGSYRFWAELYLNGTEAEYAARPGDTQRCAASLNRLLLDAGYPELYEGNPYDWIFLFAAQDEYPLEAFRSFMREVYLNKAENGLL